MKTINSKPQSDICWTSTCAILLLHIQNAAQLICPAFYYERRVSHNERLLSILSEKLPEWTERDIAKKFSFTKGAKNMSVLNEFNTNYKLQELHADIKSRGLLNLPNSREVEIYYQDQSNIEKPEKIIAAMYDLSELSDSSKKVLSIFSILPSEQISYNNLKALVKDFKEDLESSLSYLYKRGWIDYNKSTYSFKCNPIVQEITKDFNKNRIKEDVRDVVKFLIEVLAESEKKPFNYSEFQSLQKNVRYAENIIKLNFAEHEDFIHLAQELGDFYSYYSNISKSKFYYNQSLKKAIFFFENSNSGNSLLGDLYQSLGEIGDAIEYYKKDITYINSVRRQTNLDFS
ncbi:MAG TPA: hypothetical protein VFM99_06990 [Chitinophagales bacterium]|nr:hypothetical protein [Chitinophagales bacterium]